MTDTPRKVEYDPVSAPARPECMASRCHLEAIVVFYASQSVPRGVWVCHAHRQWGEDERNRRMAAAAEAGGPA